MNQACFVKGFPYNLFYKAELNGPLPSPLPHFGGEDEGEGVCILDPLFYYSCEHQ